MGGAVDCEGRHSEAEEVWGQGAVAGVKWEEFGGGPEVEIGIMGLYWKDGEERPEP